MRVERTPVPGLLVLHLDVHEDARGWFKENWNRETMLAAGLPDFGPVQQNVAFNRAAGVTRGIHAEPWDKLVSVATGRAFGAWVDLRAGATFGTVVTHELEPGTAVFVPRGVGNAYQVLEDGTAYTYLVNAHWRPDATYAAVDLADRTLPLRWPIALDDAVVSEKDRNQPSLDAITPVPPRRPLVTGADGQVGRAFAAAFPGARAVTRAELDVTDPAAVAAWPWHDHDVVLNAAAFTAVDVAETEEGRRAAWATNATAPGLLADAAIRHGLTLVHVSSDYVYDGSVELHTEDEPLAPLGVYGQSKAAGDLAAARAPRHYLLRTSWVVGEGANFVRTMARLADSGASPEVVSDQRGRPTFADDVARAARHLLDAGAPYGTYHVSGGGPVVAWADVAREVFALRDRDPGDVRPVPTEAYAAGRALAPRPRHSALDLSRLEATGFAPRDWRGALADYLRA